jgi:hypothetical protein
MKRKFIILIGGEFIILEIHHDNYFYTGWEIGIGSSGKIKRLSRFLGFLSVASPTTPKHR